VLEVADRRADADLVDAVMSTMSARLGLLHGLPLQAFELQDLVDFRLQGGGIFPVQHQHFLHRLDAPAADAADADLADVARVVERADLQLQRLVGVFVANRHVFQIASNSGAISFPTEASFEAQPCNADA